MPLQRFAHLHPAEGRLGEEGDRPYAPPEGALGVGRVNAHREAKKTQVNRRAAWRVDKLPAQLPRHAAVGAPPASFATGDAASCVRSRLVASDRHPLSSLRRSRITPAQRPISPTLPDGRLRAPLHAAEILVPVGHVDPRRTRGARDRDCRSAASPLNRARSYITST